MITCFDIGGSAIKGAVASAPDRIEPLPKVPTPLADFGAFADAVAGVIARGPGRPGDRVAVSITGVVDPDTGRIKCANIPCIDGRSLAADLEARLGCPVLVANDADCFALAEAVVGAGRGLPIVFGAILGTGVGGGLVIDGRLITGAGGFAGEWGHGPVAATMAGTPPVAVPRLACGCGQAGCVDTIGGARGLERLHGHLHGVDLPSTAIIEAWLAGDPAAGRTVDCQVDLIAGPPALVVNVTGAHLVPVGGGLANCVPLIDRLDQAVRARILRRSERPLVVPGALAIEPGLVGAGILGLQGVSA